MISLQATENIERIFQQGLRSRLPQSSDDACTIAAIQPDDNVEALATRAGGALTRARSGRTGSIAHVSGREERVVLLTISSVHFRLMMLLTGEESVANHAYFVKESSDIPFWETLSELANLCCGAVNQALLRHFPDLGMSTPYMLEAGCIAYLRDLSPSLLRSYAVSVGSAELMATLCVCAHAPIDFVADAEGVEESHGVLEMF